MTLFTIGFTKTSAERFFARLRDAGVQRLLDVRLRNVSQLAGFAKRDDLEFFLRELCGIAYQHVPELAPTSELLDAYKKKRLTWDRYELRFGELMRERQIETLVSPEEIEAACLLCSEAEPGRCHRRLIAEYLADRLEGVEIHHL